MPIPRWDLRLLQKVKSTKAMEIIEFLKNNENKRYCDDCLSAFLGIYPRQQVNQICRDLYDQGLILREKGKCSSCSKVKLVNSVDIGTKTLLGVQNTSISSINRGKRLDAREFENRVARYAENKFKKRFHHEKELQVGPNKFHKFDLVSEDKSIVIECKSYTWTRSGNFPSAKISTALEEVFYLSRIIADRKILVFQDDINSKGESLVSTFVKRYDGVLDDIEVWAYYVGNNLESDIVKVVRKPKDNWYKILYGSET